MRLEKQGMIDEMREGAVGSQFVFLLDHTGLNVERITELRGKLRSIGAELHVVRNRLFKRVANECDWKEIEEILRGPTATVSGDDDVAAAKILHESAMADSRPVMKGGVIGGVFLTAEELHELALLPSREALLGQTVATIAAPMTGLVGVMSQKLMSLLNVLKAVEDKKKVD